MATTTSNFSWPIPQSTDLVKDGATAIASLGSGIDTSMAELKGGTTGQILSKASGTDMDFTWINNDQGDITGVTAGTGLTGGGTSGSVTLDFDVANYGGGQYAAGKNKIINGDFGIWQRGTSFTNPADSSYTADRFEIRQDGNGTKIISQQTFTPGTAPVTGYEGTYFFRWNDSVAGSTQTFKVISQKIEDVRTFAGQTVTISFWAKADASRTITYYLQQNFGSGGSTSVDITSTTASLTTSWQRFTYTVAVPSISGKTIGTGSNLRLRWDLPLNVAQTIDLWGVQLEAGSTATPFQTATGTKQGELAACQRYYFRTTGQIYSGMATGFATSTTGGLLFLQMPVSMRVAPTALEYGNVRVIDSGFAGTLTTLALTTQDSSSVVAELTVTGTGYTAHRPIWLSANNNAAGYVAVTAEL